MEYFRVHHILCTSLYEGKGYSGAFCENMSSVVERLRANPEEELVPVAEPDVICAGCPNRTAGGMCAESEQCGGKGPLSRGAAGDFHRAGFNLPGTLQTGCGKDDAGDFCAKL